MIDGTPLVRPGDRFPLGLAGRTVPVSAELPTAARPWGMDCAVIPTPVELPQLGKHEKPTRTYTRNVPTTFTNDSKPQTDQRTETVTD